MFDFPLGAVKILFYFLCTCPLTCSVHQKWIDVHTHVVDAHMPSIISSAASETKLLFPEELLTSPEADKG